MKALAMPLDHHVGQSLAQAVKILATERVLESREGWLGRQSLALDGVASHQHLVNGILRQPCGIVAVGVAEGDGHDPLGQQLDHLVTDPARFPLIVDNRGQRIRQSEPGVRCPQQEPSSVGAATVVITLDDDGLANKLGEQQTLCRVIVGQAGTPFGLEKLIEQAFLARRGSCSVHFWRIIRASVSLPKTRR